MRRIFLLSLLFCLPALASEPGQPPAETDEVKKADGETGPFIAGVGDVTKPRRIKAVKPKYPKKARQARIEGKVYLQAVVYKDGSVGPIQVLKCTRPGLGFEEAAIKAVKRWLYEPARRNDEPVDVFITIDVNFISAGRTLRP